MSVQQIFSPSENSGGTHASVCPPSLDAGKRPSRPRNNTPAGHTCRWRGVSGRIYDLEEVCVRDFTLRDAHIYLLLSGEQALWVGTSSDLIQDSASRARFRQALVLATSAHCLPVNDMDPAAGIALNTDLMAGTPVREQHAA